MGSLKVFCGSSNRQLGDEVAVKLGVPVSKSLIKRFADGEIFVKIEEPIRGDDIFIVQSTSGPVNEHLMELLVMMDALKRASAGRITVVMPYYGYARQDRKASEREPITAKLVADLVTKAGADRVLTVDLHSDQIQGFFDIPHDHLTSLSLFTEYLKMKNVDVVVAPDAGSVKKVRRLAKLLNLPLAIIDKRRPEQNVAEVMHIIGDIEGKNAVVIDDMIDTGGTITAGVNALIEKGAKSAIICATHAVFSGPAVGRLKECKADEVVVTNSIMLTDDKKFNKLKQLSLAGLISAAIKCIHENKAVDDIIE